MDIGDVRRVLIVGSGTMGLQIGLQCATHGYDVAMYDLEPAALDAGSRRMDAYAEELVAAGRIGSATRDQALGRVSWTSDPAAAASEADILSESVPEDPALRPHPRAVQRALPTPRDLHDEHLHRCCPRRSRPRPRGPTASPPSTSTSPSGSRTSST